VEILELDEHQTARIAALDCVLHIFRGSEYSPNTLDMICMAEWVVSGKASEAVSKAWREYEAAVKGKG
jgi:hypothetical protein